MTSTPITPAENPALARTLSQVLPLEAGETLLWFRPAEHGYEMRVRTATGYEGMHDVYSFEMPEENQS